MYPPTRTTDLVRNVSDEKIYSYGTVTFVYVFACNLVCVQSVIQQILLKYQEIDVQIQTQTFTDESWNILHGWFYER